MEDKELNPIVNEDDGETKAPEEETSEETPKETSEEVSE